MRHLNKISETNAQWRSNLGARCPIDLSFHTGMVFEHLSEELSEHLPEQLNEHLAENFAEHPEGRLCECFDYMAVYMLGKYFGCW